MPPYRQIGAYCFWPLFVCLSLCLFVPNFNLAYKIKTPAPTSIKLHMQVPHDNLYRTCAFSGQQVKGHRVIVFKKIPTFLLGYYSYIFHGILMKLSQTFCHQEPPHILSVTRNLPPYTPLYISNFNILCKLLYTIVYMTWVPNYAYHFNNTSPSAI